jgi:nicotinamide riboside kinase
MIRRINVWGGAGTGKSTLAARIFSHLKMKNLNIEHVQEYIKLDAYEGRFPKSFDQLHVFASQVNREDRLLHHVQCLVTDSPILMNVAYAKHGQFPGSTELEILANKFEETYPSLNFLIHRKWSFQTEGRFCDEKWAKEIDAVILKVMTDNLQLTHTFYEDMEFDTMMEIIERRLA